MIQGNVGPYKITYLKADQKDILYSRMFDKIEVALDYAHSLKGSWLLFKKAGQKDDDYAWKLLPYGDYRYFSAGTTAYRYRFIILFVILVIVFYAGKNLLFKPKPMF
jgi:hypothetical protein